MPVSPKASETFSEAIADATKYTEWIIGQFAPYLGDSTLEIGIGHGSYIERLSAGRRYAGLDIDPTAVEDAQRRYKAHRFYCADLADATFPQRISERFASVFCSNVLEHIQDDRCAVGNLGHVLAPGGHLCLFVPALPALYSELDRLAGHHRRYTRRSLENVVTAAGLEVREMRYFNPIGGLGWWINRNARHQSLNAPAVNAQIRMFDRWGVPLSRAIDPLFRRMFGQSLVCVARASHGGATSPAVS